MPSFMKLNEECGCIYGGGKKHVGSIRSNALRKERNCDASGLERLSPWLKSLVRINSCVELTAINQKQL